MDVVCFEMCLGPRHFEHNELTVNGVPQSEMTGHIQGSYELYGNCGRQ
jgi:hypothetical protein